MMAVFAGVLAWVSVAVVGDAKAMFEENSPSTWATVALLLVCSWLCLRLRQGHRATGDGSASFWGWSAGAFLLAGLDDGLRLHELVEKLILAAANLPKDKVWDRLDDALVGLYALALLGVAWRWRGRVLRLRAFVACGVAGTLFFAGMVAVDLAHVNDLAGLEEGFKLVAAGWFVSAALAATWDPATPEPTPRP